MRSLIRRFSEDSKFMVICFTALSEVFTQCYAADIHIWIFSGRGERCNWCWRLNSPFHCFSRIQLHSLFINHLLSITQALIHARLMLLTPEAEKRFYSNLSTGAKLNYLQRTFLPHHFFTIFQKYLRKALVVHKSIQILIMRRKTYQRGYQKRGFPCCFQDWGNLQLVWIDFEVKKAHCNCVTVIPRMLLWVNSYWSIAQLHLLIPRDKSSRVSTSRQLREDNETLLVFPFAKYSIVSPCSLYLLLQQ